MTSPRSRVILITGASSGIGRACSIALSQAFSPLVLILSGRREAELHATAKECRDGTVTEICVGDVSDQDDVEKMFGVIKQKYGRLDVVFNVSAVDDDVGLELMRCLILSLDRWFSICLECRC